MNKDQFSKIWEDPVWSKVIAALIILIVPMIINYLINGFDWLFFIVLIVSILILIILIKLNLKNTQKKKFQQIIDKVGSKILISELEDIKDINIKKISIVGLGNVGKTTLIENICDAPNTDTRTTGRGAYIHNFSKNSFKIGAILDASGQSQSLQNGLAIKSNLLIILIDHNSSRTDTKLSNDRISKHKDFLNLLLDKLNNNEHKPEWIHFLLNKEDLWSNMNNNEKKALKKIFKNQIKIFKTFFGQKVNITNSFYSNEKTNNRKELVNFIAKKMNK